MKNSLIKSLIFLLIAIALPYLPFCQDSLIYEIQYDVTRVYPSPTISRKQLNEANSLLDLNKQYQSSWVKEYRTVEIKTINKGTKTIAITGDDTLSQEQKDNMNKADPGSSISVYVQYIPDNNLTHNDVKEMNFTFSVDPENEAKFPGGKQKLIQYLKDNGIEKISESNIHKDNLAAVKFTITEDGKVINAHVFSAAKDEKTDALLLEIICNMPDWEPAKYANGLKVKQEFVLMIGDMKSCVLNLLYVRVEN
jgi:hypothetical protein